MPEFGPIKTAFFKGHVDLTQGIREKAVVDIKDETIPEGQGPRRLEAIRKRRKRGIWPFRRGEYNVTLITPANTDSAIKLHSIWSDPLIDNGRFRNAQSAIKAGIQEFEVFERKTLQFAESRNSLRNRKTTE